MQQRQYVCVQHIAHLCPLFTQTKSWCFKVISKEHCLSLSSRKMMPPCENSTEAYSYLTELALLHNKRLLITSAHTAVMTFKLLEDFFFPFLSKWKHIVHVDIPLHFQCISIPILKVKVHFICNHCRRKTAQQVWKKETKTLLGRNGIFA